jgi:tetratricopeptide (TPR) repeat protein
MTRGRIIPFTEARALKARNPNARWVAVAAEFGGDVWPAVTPGFKLEAGQTIFTIGSCFARNIELHLADLGCRVPMLEFYLPPEEWSGGANGAMNKFHPPAFRQCLEWTARIHDRDGVVTWEDCAPLAFEWPDGRVFDMDMGVTAPVSRTRFLERRQHIYDIFSTVFRADCLMMTPGLVEAWRDCTTGLYVHEPPTQKVMVADRSRWEFEILSYQQCETDLLRAIDVVRERNPGIKVLVTTSPVPIATTFSGQDIRIANTYSKSVLRAACGAAAMLRPLVDYFPSYESATQSFPLRVWETDRIHVNSAFVGKIVTHLLDNYLEGVQDAARNLQAARTLLMDGAYDQAEAAARAAMASRPEHLEARAVLAEILLRQFRSAEAESELKITLERAPDRADLWITLARAIVRGDHARADEAIGHIQTAVALPSITLSDFRSVGELVRQRAAPEVAEQITRRTVELFPLHVEAYQHLINVLIDQGRTEEAIEVLRRTSGLRRVPAAMRLQLAELLMASDQAAEAEAVVRAVVALEPANVAAKAFLARLVPAETLNR